MPVMTPPQRLERPGRAAGCDAYKTEEYDMYIGIGGILLLILILWLLGVI
ncbi:MAG TPA: hypothetical protein VFP57_02680 [Sphingomicrobium sp.]|jgi:hypothetical protein|nr:hypothetical protein [Sphingomicrobium sp.]